MQRPLVQDHNILPSDQIIHPKVLYFGTPVVLLTTSNEDGTTNITPMSSAWALGNCIVLGLGLGSKALENLQRDCDCVLNIPSPELWEQVESLGPLTGMNPVPDYKQEMGYRHEKDKFGTACLTPLPSTAVKPDRIAECPIQIEANARHIRIPEHSPSFAVVEVESILVHAHKNIMLGDHYIDPQKWSPLIYNFRHYFGLGSQLGKNYRSET